MKLITVVVPVYNVEKYIKKCVGSLINQTYTNLEILLVNDGSKDNSLSICQELAKEDNRIRIIDKKNGGLSDARNSGIKKAKGEFITFVDSDDYVSNQYIEVLYKTIMKDKADISICSYQLVDENYRNIDDKDESVSEYSMYYREEAIKLLLMQNIIKDYAWNKMYKLSLFSEIEYPKGYLMEDLGTTYKLFYASKKIAITNEKLYFYLQRSGSILHNKSKKVFTDKYELAKDRYYYLSYRMGSFNENIISYFALLLNTYPSFSDKQKRKEIECEIRKIIMNNKKIIKEYKRIYYKFKLYSFNKNIYSFIVNLKRNR